MTFEPRYPLTDFFKALCGLFERPRQIPPAEVDLEKLKPKGITFNETLREEPYIPLVKYVAITENLETFFDIFDVNDCCYAIQAPREAEKSLRRTIIVPLDEVKIEKYKNTAAVLLDQMGNIVTLDDDMCIRRYNPKYWSLTNTQPFPYPYPGDKKEHTKVYNKLIGAVNACDYIIPTIQDLMKHSASKDLIELLNFVTELQSFVKGLLEKIDDLLDMLSNGNTQEEVDAFMKNSKYFSLQVPWDTLTDNMTQVHLDIFAYIKSWKKKIASDQQEINRFRTMRVIPGNQLDAFHLTVQEVTELNKASKKIRKLSRTKNVRIKKDSQEADDEASV